MANVAIASRQALLSPDGENGAGELTPGPATIVGGDDKNVTVQGPTAREPSTAGSTPQSRGRLGGRLPGVHTPHRTTTIKGTRWLAVERAAKRLGLTLSGIVQLIRERTLLVWSPRAVEWKHRMIREVDLDILRPVVVIPRAIAVALREAMVEALAGTGDPEDFRRRLDQLETAIEPRLEEDDPQKPGAKRRRAKATGGSHGA